MSNLLQNRINELDSAILNFVGDNVHITGFYNAARLESYLTKKIDNHSSKGLYKKEDIVFTGIKQNALFIVQKNGIELYRIQYKQLYKGPLKLVKAKTLEVVYILKDKYSDTYVVKTERYVSEFANKNEIILFLLDEYSVHLEMLL